MKASNGKMLAGLVVLGGLGALVYDYFSRAQSAAQLAHGLKAADVAANLDSRDYTKGGSMYDYTEEKS